MHPTVGTGRIAITSGGVNALMLAQQALVDAGDEVVVVTPVWPNLTAQPLIMGARLKRVSLKPVAGAWTLDLQALLDAPRQRILLGPRGELDREEVREPSPRGREATSSSTETSASGPSC